MLSIAKSMPPRQTRTPNARYHRKNEALCEGANLSSLSDPQILAALTGDAATNAPSAMATVLTNRFIAEDFPTPRPHPAPGFSPRFVTARFFNYLKEAPRQFANP